MTPAEIADARSACAAAFAAPWVAAKASEDGSRQVYAPSRGPLRVVVPIAESEGENAAFIALAREALPAALDHIAAIEARIVAADALADAAEAHNGSRATGEALDAAIAAYRGAR